MTTTRLVLDREEFIEQAYFFRVLRERLRENLATQEVLTRIHDEILSTTRLPLAIQFLATEIKHSGLLSTGFDRLQHYFAPFQAYIIRQTEIENVRFSMETALLVLQREAEYRAGTPTPAGLFVYQFETLCRNRLGYDGGLTAMAGDPMFDAAWRDFVEQVRARIGVVEFAEFIYLRSDWYVRDERRQDPDYIPPIAPLFGEKEGKIARANLGRDPLYFFAALQRQLGYPEVPRPKPLDDTASKLLDLQRRLRDMEKRILLVESEVRGQMDIMQQLGRPELLRNDDDDEV